MSRSCALIAAQLGWSQCRCVALRAASALHDVGKVGVPDNVLRKPGPLDSRERVLVERHPMIGHQILAGSGDEVVELAARVALTHHERFDGAGYPSHLRGAEIPIEGRIAAVADVFDALTNDRIYRPAFEPDEALETMRRERGSHFDPAVFSAFEHLLEDILETARRYPDAARREPARPSEKSHVVAPSVLIVEGHEAIAKGLALLLRREGLAVVGSASHLDQARALLRRRRPDVAIVDLDVVGASGLGLI
ncbi:MAG: HD domain-containing protein, partial [Chloroflexota bacterium]|nr:HD domain-containing protein [Chloroflexota bacterium]